MKLIKFDACVCVEEAIQDHVVDAFRRTGKLPVIHLPPPLLFQALRRLPNALHTQLYGGGEQPIFCYVYTVAGVVKVVEDQTILVDPLWPDTFGLEDA